MQHDKTAKELLLLKEDEVVRVKEGKKWNPDRAKYCCSDPEYPETQPVETSTNATTRSCRTIRVAERFKAYAKY